MNVVEHTKRVMRTLKRLESTRMDNLHLVLGMATEVGELLDVFKKYIAYGKEIDWINAQEEVGDLLYYIFAFCSINKLDFEKICEQNFSKLKIRYPEVYTDQSALERDLTEERRILKELGYKVD